MKNDLPLVSVIAVCYNHAKFVTETLDSVKNQTYANIELIIMDDCSTDNSVEVIQQWVKETNYPCQFIAHQDNQGLCKTLNEALNFIKGEYYQGLACDDIIIKEKIETQVNLFKKLDNDYAVIYSDAYLMNNKSELYYGNFIQRHKPKMLEIPSGDIYEELLLSNYIPAMSVLIKTDSVKNIEGYDENLTYEDYDLWLRLAKTFKFYFSDYKSCKYRIHDNNMHSSSNFKKSALINSFIIYNKHSDKEISKHKLKNIINNLYKNDLHYQFKDDVLRLALTPRIIKCIKSNLNYKQCQRKIMLEKISKKMKLNIKQIFNL
ncbi:glycosyltransferase family 2 protein [Mesohalobacter salilacus]|uniref:glycosyltransferase family 2 protein n=1 Tax=Mesohalobacter salilacus TaxID=2491711 RepID=UPI00267C3219